MRRKVALALLVLVALALQPRRAMATEEVRVGRHTPALTQRSRALMGARAAARWQEEEEDEEPTEEPTDFKPAGAAVPDLHVHYTYEDEVRGGMCAAAWLQLRVCRACAVLTCAWGRRIRPRWTLCATVRWSRRTAR